MVWAIAVGTVIFILIAGILGGAGFYGGFVKGEHHPGVVNKIIDWMF